MLGYEQTDAASELLKHKLFFGSKEYFEDADLRYELSVFGPVVDYTRHKDSTNSKVKFLMRMKLKEGRLT